MAAALRNDGLGAIGWAPSPRKPHVRADCTQASAIHTPAKAAGAKPAFGPCCPVGKSLASPLPEGGHHDQEPKARNEGHR